MTTQAPLYKPDGLTELRALIADDAWAISFQTFGQYRTALLRAADKIAATPKDAAPPGYKVGACRLDEQALRQWLVNVEQNFANDRKVRDAAGLLLLEAAAGVPAVDMAQQLADMAARKDGAYEERNKVVAALAKVFPSGVARTAIEGWSEDWHGCVYIDLPTGQVSWHFHDSQAHLFAGLPPYTKPWDGHDTPEKYRRLAALAAAPSAKEDGNG